MADSAVNEEELSHVPDPKSWNSFSKSGLAFSHVLGSFANGHRVACLCHSSSMSDEQVTDKNKAVVVLEKLPISETDVVDLLACKTAHSDTSSLIHANDIYYTFHVNPHVTSNLNRLKATVVLPATERHVAKYSFSETAVIVETPESYAEVTKPYIIENQLALRWVYNILDGKAETERVLYSDPDPENGFILLPDMKWDGISDPKQRLYLVAIVRKRDVLSMRDLTSEHLPLLERIANFVPEFISQKYDIPRDRLRVFFHYLPSYWHLHVHFVVGAFAGEDGGASGGLWSADRAHFLSTVISNIRLMSDYYQRATLAYTLRTDNPLHSRHVAFLQKNTSNKVEKNGKSKESVDEPEAKNRRLE